MSLVFEYAAPPGVPDPDRADVACCVGFVARRPGVPLPEPLRNQLAAAGWVNGIWARPPQEIEDLLNLPVALDSWDQFDQVFDWAARPVDADSGRACAGHLGAAVRAFFARGGRRAIVIRVGDPWPYRETAAARAAARAGRLAALLPGERFDPGDPATWQGIGHLCGLDEASMLLLPDLADACATEAPEADLATTPPQTPEGFAECSADEPVAQDSNLAATPAPRLDITGYASWKQAQQNARAFLDRRRRDVLLVASLPLPHVEASGLDSGMNRVHAQVNMLAWLQSVVGVLDDGDDRDRPAQALVQLAWPWLATRDAGDLPQGLEPPEGSLAGLIAAGALQRGCHRSVAGDNSLARLRDVSGGEPTPAWGLDASSPDALLAQRVCVFAPQPEGWALQSDVTTAARGACRFGGASRLLASLSRTCRAAGANALFEPNGEATWARLRQILGHVLMRYWKAGAFSGASPSQAFEVRCDRAIMSQNDLDNGRLIVILDVWPAQSIERISVVLNLGNTAGSLREAA